ncbi:helix-turn-helix domain-containing protein [Haloarculaceae archaeon H-GB2-1]|nr:helix-turn-helix domain-containing protein [Haloarculaceae archaeon H-GB1-1]MEA5386879.1 helix-turn-helix domain-containing protein [Haloarculaceae archaeon H-GB11]MEA5408357.1 helix-turn-helix domain-containing protein [Haloarculaceae archaeon H-GB2-1]
MPCANLRIDIPEGVWIGDVSREHPETRFRILSAFAGEDAGVGLAEITGPALSKVVTAIDDADAVLECAPLQFDDERALVQFETDLPLLLSPVQDSGAPMKLPFDIVDGEASWEVTASRDRLSRLGTQLDQLGIRFHVDSVQQRVEMDQLLTERQQSLVRAAVDQGYYDTPRGCSLTDLAAELDIAKSTCSETLHRAEEKIVKSFVEESAEPSASPVVQ